MNNRLTVVGGDGIYTGATDTSTHTEHWILAPARLTYHSPAACGRHRDGGAKSCELTFARDLRNACVDTF
jgi:hypothetical protein